MSNHKKNINKTITFTITLKWTKYLGINLPKEAKNLYNETIKCGWKKLKTKNLKGIPHSYSRRLNIVKILIPSKAIYRFNAILSKF